MKTVILYIPLLLLSYSNCLGAVQLNLSGLPNSNIVNFIATGSIIAEEALDASIATPAPSGVGRMPDGGWWSDAYHFQIGDVISNGQSSMTRTLSDDVTLLLNGIPFGTWKRISMGSGSPLDSIKMGPFGTSIQYPDLQPGDVISWQGSGTFTLSSGTFGSYFNAGSYSKAIDGGNYEINIAPVPEPSTYGAIFGILTFLFIAQRRILYRKNSSSQ